MGNLPIKIISITGLGLPQKERNVSNYPWQSGQTLVSEKDRERTITLSCDAYGVDTVNKVCHILRNPGTMFLNLGEKKRRIDCTCTTFDEPEKHGNIYKLIMQFTCDNPFFKDYYDIQLPLYQRHNEVFNLFTLPCVFTSRTNEITTTLHGEHEAEPIITVKCLKKGSVSESVGLKLILSNSASEYVTLNLDYDFLQQDEEIVFDIPKRKITSSASGNLLNKLSEDSIISDFVMTVGENTIELIANNSNDTISAKLVYSGLYSEAIF